MSHHLHSDTEGDDGPELSPGEVMAALYPGLEDGDDPADLYPDGTCGPTRPGPGSTDGRHSTE